MTIHRNGREVAQGRITTIYLSPKHRANEVQEVLIPVATSADEFFERDLPVHGADEEDRHPDPEEVVSMSGMLMTAICDAGEILEQSGLTPYDRYVFIMLANRYNHTTGRCDPSYERLAKDTGVCRNTISNSLQALNQAGFISWAGRSKPGSKEKASNQYTIHYSANAKSGAFILQPRSVPAKSTPSPQGDLPGSASDGLPTPTGCTTVAHPVVLGSPRGDVGSPPDSRETGRNLQKQTGIETRGTTSTYRGGEMLTKEEGRQQEEEGIREEGVIGSLTIQEYQSLSPARKLAWDFFLMMDQPEKDRTLVVQEEWARKFESLLARRPFDKIKGAIHYAWKVSSYWPTVLYRDDDSVAYFVAKFFARDGKKGIEDDYLPWRHKQSLASQPTMPGIRSEPFPSTGVTGLTFTPQEEVLAQAQKNTAEFEAKLALQRARQREQEEKAEALRLRVEARDRQIELDNEKETR